MEENENFEVTENQIVGTLEGVPKEFHPYYEPSPEGEGFQLRDPGSMVNALQKQSATIKELTKANSYEKELKQLGTPQEIKELINQLSAPAPEPIPEATANNTDDATADTTEGLTVSSQHHKQQMAKIHKDWTTKHADEIRKIREESNRKIQEEINVSTKEHMKAAFKNANAVDKPHTLAFLAEYAMPKAERSVDEFGNVKYLMKDEQGDYMVSEIDPSTIMDINMYAATLAVDPAWSSFFNTNAKPGTGTPTAGGAHRPGIQKSAFQEQLGDLLS